MRRVTRATPATRLLRGVSLAILLGSTGYLAVGPIGADARPGAATAPRVMSEPGGAGATRRLDLPALAAWCLEQGLPAPPHVPLAETAVAEGLLGAYDEAARSGTAAAFGRLGRRLASLEARAGAEQAFARAAEQEPDVFAWSYHRGVLAQEDGRPRAAIALLEQAARLDPDYPTTWARLGQLQFDAGDDDRARVSFETYTRLAPADGFGLVGLARLALRADDAVEALRLARQADALRPDDFQTQHTLGTILAARGDTATATVHFERARRLPQGRWFALRDPLVSEIHQLAGSTHGLTREFERLRDGGDLDTLQRLAEQIVARRPDDALMLRNLAEIHRRRGEFAAAHAALDRALAVTPDAPDAHVARSAVALAQADHEAALAAADRALAAAPDHATAWSLRGRALWLLGRTGEGEEAWSRSVALAPEDVPTLTLLAFARESRGAVDEATADYRRALTLDPDNRAAREGLARLSAADR